MIDPLHSEADLIVYVDVKSPYAYLSIAPLRSLASDLGQTIDWRPLTLNIPSFLGSAKVSDRGEVIEENRTPRQWLGVRYAYMDVKRYARMRDVLIYGPRKIWDTRLVHIALLWVKATDPQRLDDFLDTVFQRFWIRELNVEDIHVVEQLLAEIRVSIEGFKDFVDGEGGQTHDSLQALLYPVGIFGVPTIVVENEIFFGREHFPFIRWILTGRERKPPDVAYEMGQLT